MPDVLTFAAASLIIALTPGPSWIYVIGRTVMQGSLAGLAAVAGNTMGIAVHTVAVALGVSLIVRTSEAAFTILKVAGVLYLISLALRTLRHGLKTDGPPLPPIRRWRIVAEAAMVSVTNPKVALLFIALLPQFLRPETGSALPQMLILGGVHMAVATLVTLGLVAGAKRLRSLFLRNGRFARWFRWSAGAALLAMAGKLALAQR